MQSSRGLLAAFAVSAFPIRSPLIQTAPGFSELSEEEQNNKKAGGSVTGLCHLKVKNLDDFPASHTSYIYKSRERTKKSKKKKNLPLKLLDLCTSYGFYVSMFCINW
ncbi:hypothetical protein Droror1_Dr00011502 [Drosera rotundifolia]